MMCTQFNKCRRGRFLSESAAGVGRMARFPGRDGRPHNSRTLQPFTRGKVKAPGRPLPAGIMPLLHEK